MGLPGHRRTSSHKRRRAAHFAMKKVNIASCPKCSQPIAPHTACRTCGSYNGRAVRDTSRAAARIVKKTTAKKPAAPETPAS